MAENDLNQKVRLRSLLWRQGFYPRLNVKVTGHIDEGSSSKLVPLELTDIDVLGVRITDAFKLEFAIADCKTGKISTASRAFFLRGLMDFFGADRAYLVVQKPVSTATQAITSRFNITPVDPGTLTHMESAFQTAQAPSILLEESLAKREELNNLASVNGLDEALEYRKYYYWFYDDNRNLQNLPTLAGRASSRLSLRSNYHRFLMHDYLLLYTISLVRACEHVMLSDLSQAEEVAGHYFFGGTTALRERRAIFSILKNNIYPNLTSRAKGQLSLDDLSLEPKYFGTYLEIVFRLLRRPVEARDLLRFIHLVGLMHLNGSTPELEAILESFSPITAKLAEDIAALFCAAAEMDPAWLSASAYAVKPQLPLPAKAPKRIELGPEIHIRLPVAEHNAEEARRSREAMAGPTLTTDDTAVRTIPATPEPATKQVETAAPYSAERATAPAPGTTHATVGEAEQDPGLSEASASKGDRVQDSTGSPGSEPL